MSARLGGALLVTLVTAGCAVGVAGTPREASQEAVDAGLVGGYFSDGLAAARTGVAAQREFLTRTQHPDFRAGACDPGELVLTVEPALSTLRPDPGWTAGSRGRPRGRVYVVAVSVTAKRDGATVGIQIGSQHVVVLDGAAYGFAPCPR
ncbi:MULTISPECIES: hypothetical protein [unclassified Crossiella]|uniref:hypothetical protein n=1 Tax=Crossiella sp. SN42 TaxID=2944808 RepID=UPI00207C2AC8|nr:hypothetical protein [Crossiella sp. SN42]MCO1579425.1 hypothetical protein [Crossiella sp. SN42]